MLTCSLLFLCRRLLCSKSRSLTELATCSRRAAALSWPKMLPSKSVFSCSIASCSFRRELSARAACGRQGTMPVRQPGRPKLTPFPTVPAMEPCVCGRWKKQHSRNRLMEIHWEALNFRIHVGCLLPSLTHLIAKSHVATHHLSCLGNPAPPPIITTTCYDTLSLHHDHHQL